MIKAEIIGLTGQTGAGKSSVREMLRKQGAAVIDADTVAHDIADNEIWCLVEIVEHFSCLVLNDKGKLNRKALGRMVFSDKKQLLALNKIMFPYIREAIEKQIDELLNAGAKLIIVDGATLIESKCSKMCSVLISVTADEKTRLNRIIERDKLSKTDAEKRISSQHPEEFYADESDFVIKNDGTREELEREVSFVLGKIAEKRHNEILTEVGY